LKFLTNTTLKEALFILIAAATVGGIANFFHPHRIEITWSRPAIEFAFDDSASQSLPTIDIDETKSTNKQTEPASLSTSQIKALLKKNSLILIDSRSRDKFAHEHIPGALNIPYHSLADNKALLTKLQPEKWLVVYCDRAPCDTAELLAFELLCAGFQKVGVYTEGMNGWKNRFERKK